ncbi:methylated-DNA--[protein]-cysteine S-methyltransferase [Streptomyces phytophilus]|uniref:methylated-DNA--[protein]-cysteine S-methyltransferase n=1 Tax=Streptomyces phytophilus TaxID=722715 RepID=UPI0015F0228D|nr:methylated-DNA--[protein]-cysteine S-methyltransferase [Streptomyces phytophilus]
MNATDAIAPRTGRRVVDSPIGPLLLAATDRGLVKVGFHAKPDAAGADAAGADAGARAEEPAGSAGHIAAAEEQLRAYFSGGLKEFRLELDWSLSDGFNRRVLEELAARVPFGSVVSYQFLADRVGEPGAAQAVGRAMASNPLPIVVPCHRVIESTGGLGGFGGGLDTKRSLLALEGVLPEPLF